MNCYPHPLLLLPAYQHDDREAHFVRVRIGRYIISHTARSRQPSLSQKKWAQNYHQVETIRFLIDPSPDAINTEFGDETALDGHLLDRHMSPLNHTAEWLQKEGDSVRTFYTHIAHPIQVAFQTQHGTPFIVLRSESGPLGTTHVRQTVDFTWAFQDHALLIGSTRCMG